MVVGKIIVMIAANGYLLLQLPRLDSSTGVNFVELTLMDVHMLNAALAEAVRL